MVPQSDGFDRPFTRAAVGRRQADRESSCAIERQDESAGDDLIQNARRRRELKSHQFQRRPLQKGSAQNGLMAAPEFLKRRSQFGIRGAEFVEQPRSILVGQISQLNDNVSERRSSSGVILPLACHHGRPFRSSQYGLHRAIHFF